MITYRPFFRTLANDTRLRILHFLAEHGTACVSDIVAGTGLRQSTVSVNLQQLLQCRFVRLVRQGREHCYSLNAETIRPLLRLLDRHVEKYCQECR
ncbi:MAG: hypothetical protein G01um101438_115 [Parcubacteria group bacterium Gr01-1014_38]|nr:MAG: hypothetical protein G01um101438_115 [Parcubacteria group bacterium Gr01-1014_38]